MIGKTKAIDDKIRQSFIHHLKNRSQKLTPSSSLKYAFDLSLNLSSSKANFCFDSLKRNQLIDNNRNKLIGTNRNKSIDYK